MTTQSKRTASAPTPVDDSATPSRGSGAKKSSDDISEGASSYRLLYNAYALLGWLYIISLIVIFFVRDFEESFTQYGASGAFLKLWVAVEYPLKIVQTSALLEVVHAMVGIVKAPVGTTAMQVASRLFVLWFSCNICETTTTQASDRLFVQQGFFDTSANAKISWAFGLMVIAWALSEPPRYVFYILKYSAPFHAAMNHKPGEAPLRLSPMMSFTVASVKWFRYTPFIILYPLGITGEMLCMYLSEPIFGKIVSPPFTMPNAYNLFIPAAARTIPYAIYVAWVYGGYIMIGLMCKNRTKELGSCFRSTAAEKSTATKEKTG